MKNANEQEIKKIRRKDRLPSIFCAFPWVRRSPNPFADVDTIEDKKLVSICQHLLTGKADISELDEVSYLALAADVPTKIVEAIRQIEPRIHPRMLWLESLRCELSL
jgi:hypothetical protein